MRVELRALESIIPYVRNPRKNQSAIPKVKASLKEFGWRQPIVVDQEGVIIVGHTRYLAALELGWTEAPVHVAENLTPSQVKAYRLADNRTNQEAMWDDDLLKLELEDLKNLDFDLKLTGFDEELTKFDDLSSDVVDDTYSRKIEAPIYKITGKCPLVNELYDDEKTNKLINSIKEANLTHDVEEFLVQAARRHTVFNFAKIAEFYAHANKEIQLLMEESALVIIDFNKAIENGFVQLSDRLGIIADQEEDANQ